MNEEQLANAHLTTALRLALTRMEACKAQLEMGTAWREPGSPECNAWVELYEGLGMLPDVEGLGRPEMAKFYSEWLDLYSEVEKYRATLHKITLVPGVPGMVKEMVFQATHEQ